MSKKTKQSEYPFTPELLDALPEELAELFRALELTLLEKICGQLNARDQINQTSIEAIRALRAHGIDVEEVKKTIQAQTGIGESKLEALIDDVVAHNQAYCDEIIDFAGLTRPPVLVAEADIYAIREQTLGEYRNITRSMGFVVNGGRTKLSPADAYQWVLDNAVMQIQSGTAGYNQAIRGAVKQLADSGLKQVGYESGHLDSVDVAVRRAVMTGVSQLNDKYTEQAAIAVGTHYFEVSAHIGARDKPGVPPWASHKEWQGKVYSLMAGDIYPSIYEVCGLGEVDGLEGINCRHRRYLFVEGVSERTYTDEQLAHIDDGHDVTYDGQHYAAYEATQMQRRMERTIRKLKREKTAYQAAGLREDAQATNIRIRRLNQKYREFSKAAGLPEQQERMRVTYPANTLQSTQNSGIISMSIDQPINARDSTVGKPNAVSIFGSKLSKRQETLLSQLPGYDSRVTVPKRSVNMKDLASLTAKTGVEFAMFTKGGERLIVRGNRARVNISVEMAKSLAADGYRWSGHTHPGSDELTTMASYGDVEVLKAFGQLQSAIYDSLGRHQIFRR